MPRFSYMQGKVWYHELRFEIKWKWAATHSGHFIRIKLFSKTMSGYLVGLSGGPFSRGKEIQYTLEVKEVIYKEGVVKVKVEVDKEVEVYVELG